MERFEEYKNYVTTAFEAVNKAVVARDTATLLSGPSYSDYMDFDIDDARGYSIVSDYSLNGYKCTLIAQVALEPNGKRYGMSLGFYSDNPDKRTIPLCVDQGSVSLTQNRDTDEISSRFNDFLSEKLGEDFSGFVKFEPIPGQNGPMPIVRPKSPLPSSVAPK